MNFSFTIFTHISVEFSTFFLWLLTMVTGTVKRSSNGSADGMSPKVMGQSHKVTLALNQKVKGSFGGRF